MFGLRLMVTLDYRCYIKVFLYCAVAQADSGVFTYLQSQSRDGMT